MPPMQGQLVVQTQRRTKEFNLDFRCAIYEKTHHKAGSFVYGAPGEIRTPDRSVRRRVFENLNCYKSIACDLDRFYEAAKNRVKKCKVVM
jgi:hypothetical protein